MWTFQIPINLNIIQWSRLLQRPQTITLIKWAQNFWLMSFFVLSPLIPWDNLQDWCKISKCLIWLVQDTNPKVAIWLVWATTPYTLTWSVFFFQKKKTKNDGHMPFVLSSKRWWQSIVITEKGNIQIMYSFKIATLLRAGV